MTEHGLKEIVRTQNLIRITKERMLWRAMISTYWGWKSVFFCFFPTLGKIRRVEY